MTRYHIASADGRLLGLDGEWHAPGAPCVFVAPSLEAAQRLLENLTAFGLECRPVPVDSQGAKNHDHADRAV